MSSSLVLGRQHGIGNSRNIHMSEKCKGCRAAKEGNIAADTAKRKEVQYKRQWHHDENLSLDLPNLQSRSHFGTYSSDQ